MTALKRKEQAKKDYKPCATGIVLKRLMDEKRVSLSEIGEHTGLLPNSLYQLLTGRNNSPKITTIIPLAKYFKISVGQMAGEESLYNNNKNEDISQNSTELEWKNNYFLDCVNTFNSLINKKDLEFINIVSALKCIKEIYEYSLTNNRKKPDEDFANWIIKQYF